MIHRLLPTIPLDTDRGKADAHLVIDYSENHHLIWVAFLRESGECWSFDNREVRLEKNVTMGIRTEGKA